MDKKWLVKSQEQKFVKRNIAECVIILQVQQQRPRLAVFRSNNHMYAQIIDDTVGNTLVSASTLDKDLKAELEKTNNVDAAAKLGTVIAKKALDKGITTVVFDQRRFYLRRQGKGIS